MKNNDKATKLRDEIHAQARVIAHIGNALHWGRVIDSESDFMASIAKSDIADAEKKLQDVTDTEAHALLKRYIEQTHELLQEGGAA